jgi:hypothetical protein
MEARRVFLGGTLGRECVYRTCCTPGLFLGSREREWSRNDDSRNVKCAGEPDRERKVGERRRKKKKIDVRVNDD